MIGAIGSVTLRALISRRRAILMVLLCLAPVGMGLLVRFRGLPGDPVDRTASLIELLIVRSVLPLVALVFGTSAIGAELEDGTAVHLLTKPIGRWRIVSGKLLAAAPVAAVLVTGSTLLTGIAVGAERGTMPVTIAFAIAVAIGSLAYVVVFIALSVITTRALIIGLIYVVIWEGILAGLFEGTRVLSIREYTMSLAAALAPEGVVGTASAPLALSTAIPALVIAIIAAFVLASERLAVVETASGD